MDAYEAVIARYEEDVSWARKLKVPFVVYNKGASETGLEDTYRVTRRPNVGRESETFLSHIIEHYDSLPEHLVFLQGNPFDHCHRAVEIIHTLPLGAGLVPLSGNFKHEILSAPYNWEGFGETLQSLASLMGLSESSAVIYATGAQYAVPREAMLAREKSFYESLLPMVNHSSNPLEGWAMERLWPYLFGAKNKTDMFALDIILLPGAPASAAALPWAQPDMRDIELFAYDAADLEDARQIAQKNAQDLVCIVGEGAPVAFNTLMRLINLYFQYKYTILKEDDPVLLAPGIFLAHVGILRQHWHNGEPLPGEGVLRARGVPAFLAAI